MLMHKVKIIDQKITAALPNRLEMGDQKMGPTARLAMAAEIWVIRQAYKPIVRGVYTIG